MPEPDWNRIGAVDEVSRVFWDSDTEVGRVDLYGELYRSSSNYDFYCSPQYITQYPGVDYPEGSMCENWSTEMQHNYIGNDSIINIREWGPTEPKTGSLSWSMGISAGTSGIGGSVNASYSVPYIERDTAVSLSNHTIGNQYYYPSTLNPFDPEANKNIVSLENISSAVREPEEWSEPYGNYQDILSHKIKSEFYEPPGAVLPTEVTEVFTVNADPF